MKEIGMEKLIELLNEYRNDGVEEYLENIKSFKIKGGHYSDLYVISKKFGFIKWLVENDKIDYESVRKGENPDSRWDFETIQPEYFMIMLLSVQDNPIDFLISILK